MLFKFISMNNVIRINISSVSYSVSLHQDLGLVWLGYVTLRYVWFGLVWLG